MVKQHESVVLCIVYKDIMTACDNSQTRNRYLQDCGVQCYGVFAVCVICRVFGTMIVILSQHKIFCNDSINYYM